MQLIILLASFMLAVVAAPGVIALYRSFGWVEDPKKKKHPKVIHERSVPRGGGLVVFIAILGASLMFLQINVQIAAILFAASIIVTLGLFDDVIDLNPYLRLPFLFAAAGVVIFSGVRIDYLSNPFGEGVIHFNQFMYTLKLGTSTFSFSLLADVLAIIWIVWTMTIVNWSKGLDGQMPGFVGIAALVIAMLSLRFSTDPAQTNVTNLAMIVSGAFFGFLLWNMYPQKMMAGYGAGSLAGFFLAILSILSGAKVATALLVLAVPMIDAVYVVTRRIVNGKSPLWGDRGHLHHRLLDMGWGKRRIAMFYWMTTAILGFLSLQLNSQQKLYTILGVALLFGGFIAWVTLFFSSSRQLARDNG
jgi:UDP-GlcNAc:undecaprenyl-phosphate GlcNAc-1-phosphate transferase